MKAVDAFSPLGVVDITADGEDDELRFEPAIGPEEEPGEGAEEELPDPNEEEIRRQLEQAELAEESGQIPPKAGLKPRREKASGPTFASNLRINRTALSPAEKLPPIPTHGDLAGLLEHDVTKNALLRLQSTRTVLSKQLSSLQKYLSEGGVASRLQDRARELEIRSSDPVWLVVEASLDSAWRITSGLEIFSESLGVYLEYEFTKVQLYDAVIARLEQALAENELLRGELQQMRTIVEAVQKELLNLEGNQYGAFNTLPEFAKTVATQFGKALESGRALAEKTELASKRLSAFSLWLKIAIAVGASGLAACGVLGWLLISRLQ
jgi:hypothetical protein